VTSRFSKLELPDEEPQPASQEPSNAERPLALAEAARARGDHEAALRYYARALGESANLEIAWIGQVLCLIDLGELKSLDTHQARALTVVTEFSSIKEKKDMLRGLPDRQKVEAQRANWRRRAAETGAPPDKAAETRAPVDKAAGTGARADKVEKRADVARDVASQRAAGRAVRALHPTTASEATRRVGYASGLTRHRGCA
jgi:tetratricopeptide (TPR) repeat protein